MSALQNVEDVIQDDQAVQLIANGTTLLGDALACPTYGYGLAWVVSCAPATVMNMTAAVSIRVKNPARLVIT